MLTVSKIVQFFSYSFNLEHYRFTILYNFNVALSMEKIQQLMYKKTDFFLNVHCKKKISNVFTMLHPPQQLNPHNDGPLASPLYDGPRSVWTQQKGRNLKKKTGFDDVSQVRSELRLSVEGHCYNSRLPPVSPSGFPIIIFVIQVACDTYLNTIFG